MEAIDQFLEGLGLSVSRDAATTLALASAVVLLLSFISFAFRRKTSQQPGNALHSGGSLFSRGSIFSTTSKKGSVNVQAGAPASNKPKAYLLFGTQTGTAERFCKSLRTQLTQRYGDSMEFEVLDMEEYKYEERLAQEKLVFLIAATYGDGEPTDNASAFYSHVLQLEEDVKAGDKEPNLQGVHYAVFGLGNKQYEHFCAVGKRFYTALEALGATSVVRRGDGDDDEDIDADFSAWCEELFAAMDKSDLVKKQKVAELSAADIPAYDVRLLGINAKEAPVAAQGKGTDANSLFNARVDTVRELHTPESGRSCIHVELDIRGSAIQYSAGDHVAVYAENSAASVAKAARLLGVDPDTVIEVQLPAGNPAQLSTPIPGPIKLRVALARYVDLVGPVHREQLAALAAFAADELEAAKLRELSSLDGKDAFQQYIVDSKRNLLEVLEAFPSAKPPLGVFFGSVALRLQPRFYSISSSPLQHPEAVHITCAVVNETTSTGRVHEGVASSWLARALSGDTVPVYVRHSHFRLPADRRAPVVMVGPGTGIAPFRGFLQERQALIEQGQTLGPAVLFFGCRNRAHDYIYQAELEKWLKSGVLTQLHVAFSREGKQKDYVQHHMVKQGGALWQLLDGSVKGSLYVCGDAKHMAKDVHRALQDVIIVARKCSATQAEALVKDVNDSNRYQKDVW